MPFYEVFISIFRCTNDYHYLVQDLECVGTYHIVLSLVTCVGLTAHISLNLIVSLLYNETQPVKEDSLARLDSNFEIIMLLYRVLIGTLT